MTELENLSNKHRSKIKVLQVRTNDFEQKAIDKYAEFMGLNDTSKALRSMIRDALQFRSILGDIIITVKNCARCGEDHNQVAFYKFTNPIYDSDGTVWNYWRLCPSTHEPILLKVVQNDD